MRKYVHRVGRTARAGRKGDAWTLVEEQEVRVAHIARCPEKYRTYEMLGEIFQGDAARRWADGGRGESSCE